MTDLCVNELCVTRVGPQHSTWSTAQHGTGPQLAPLRFLTLLSQCCRVLLYAPYRVQIIRHPALFVPTTAARDRSTALPERTSASETNDPPRDLEDRAPASASAKVEEVPALVSHLFCFIVADWKAIHNARSARQVP